MKSGELLPTDENLIEFLSQDTIGRNKDIVYFYKIIQAQESESTIAIDGKWGSGKTFFIRQTEMAIKALNPFSSMDDSLKEKVKTKLHFNNIGEYEQSIISVYYDAWENDNEVKPIISIIYEIAQQLKEEFSIDNSGIFNFASAIIETISGRNVKGMIEALLSNDSFAEFKSQRKFKDSIKSFLTGVLNEKANRLVIFIDELDRCKPTFTVQLLEQIKHYLADDRITFVFSVNIEQLQHTIKHYYGVEFDACRYLDRFFDLIISLPPANMDKFYNQIGIGSSYYIDIVTKRVIKMFDFQLREITRLYSQVKFAAYSSTHDSESKGIFLRSEEKNIIMMYIVPLLIGLKIADASKYYDFVDGRDVKPLKELLSLEEDRAFLRSMLNHGESFESSDESVLVTSEEIIERFYEAIFVNQYVKESSITLGHYDFNKKSKEFAIEIANMMSDYAKLT